MMKRKNHFVNGENTIIGEGTVIEGHMKATASTRIDGIINGDVTSDGVIIVGSRGTINGAVTASDLNISGVVNGNVSVTGKVELVAEGKLYGDVKTGCISIEETAFFQGSCSMGIVENKTPVNENTQEAPTAE